MAVDTLPPDKKENFRSPKDSGSKKRFGATFHFAKLLDYARFYIYSRIFCAFYMSLTDWNILSQPNFIGLENYQKISQIHCQRDVLQYLLLYGRQRTNQCVLTLVLAVLLNQKIKRITFFRTAYYLPVISASVAVSLMFMWILANNGLLNQILGASAWNLFAG